MGMDICPVFVWMELMMSDKISKESYYFVISVSSEKIYSRLQYVWLMQRLLSFLFASRSKLELGHRKFCLPPFSTNPPRESPDITLKGKGKGSFMGLFQHCGRSAYCILTPNKFPHSYPEAPRIIQMRETSTSEGGNYYQWILLENL